MLQNVHDHSAVRRRRLSLLLAAATMGLANGCASWGGRGPVPESVATCRELACQGVAAVESGDWIRAESLLRQAIEASPTDAVSRRHLAEVLWRSGQTSEAVLQAEAALRLAPEDASLAVRSGEMLLATGAVDRALQRAEQAVGLDPRLASAWALRGRVFWYQNQMDRALADLQRSLQFAPGATDVLLDLAALYRQRKEHQRCLTTVQHLLDACPPGEGPQFALLLEGLTLADLNRWEDAAASLAVAATRGAPNAEVYFQLARAELHAGRPQAATRAVNQALAADAAHAPSLELLAQIAQSVPADGSKLR